MTITKKLRKRFLAVLLVLLVPTELPAVAGVAVAGEQVDLVAAAVAVASVAAAVVAVVLVAIGNCLKIAIINQ